MRYVAAYLLAVLGGNENPSAKDIHQILNSVGVDVEDDKLALVIKQLNGKDVEQVIEAGNERLATVAFGGGGAVAVTAAADAGEKTDEATEKKEDKDAGADDSDSDSDAGIISLFD